MPVWLSCQPFEQLIALLAATPFASCTGVGLIHDHELAAAAQKAVAISIALDPIQAHHRERDHFKDRLPRWQLSLKPLRCSGTHHLGGKLELARHVVAPLLTEVRWTDHRHLADFTAVIKLSCN